MVRIDSMTLFQELLKRRGQYVTDDTEIVDGWLTEWAKNGCPYFLPQYIRSLADVLKQSGSKKKSHKRKYNCSETKEMSRKRKREEP